VRRFVPISTCALGLVLLAACGAPSLVNSSGTTTGETDADLDADDDDDGLEDDDGATACETEVAALIPSVTRPDGTCSVLVRVHHETLTLLGYQPMCAELPDDALDEPQARALTDCCASAGTALPPADDWAPWGFHAAPTEDEPGHAAIVSSHVGARVFEATIGRGEVSGEIAFPEAWVEGTSLRPGCDPVPMPELASHDLVEGGGVADERLRGVWSVVGSTALPLAMGVAGEPLRATVLRWPRRVDEFDPTSAEYLVVIEIGATDGPAPED
jgi:hypothetical protein